MILNNVRALEFVRDHVGEELTPEFICGVHNTRPDQDEVSPERAELNNRQTRPSPPGRTAGMKSTLTARLGLTQPIRTPMGATPLIATLNPVHKTRPGRPGAPHQP